MANDDLNVNMGNENIFDPTPDVHDTDTSPHDVLGTNEGTLSLREYFGTLKLYARSPAPSKKEVKATSPKQNRKQYNHRRANDPNLARNQPTKDHDARAIPAGGLWKKPTDGSYIPPRLKSTSPFTSRPNQALWSR